MSRTMTRHLARTNGKMKVIREHGLWHRPTKTPRRKPRRKWNQFTESKGSTSGQRSVEQLSCLSQRILDLGEVANAHHLENQQVDVRFKFSHSQGAGALPASWLPGDRSRGLLTRSSWFFAGGGCHRLGLLGLPTKVARQTQGCSHLVDEGSTDGPVESGCRPRLVHGFEVAFGMVVEELFQEAGLAWRNDCCFGHSGG